MKAVLKSAAISEINEGSVAFAKTIDFSELFEHIKKSLNIECSFNQPEISTLYHKTYVKFNSEDIIGEAGFFAPLFDKCCIKSIGGAVYKDESNGDLCPFFYETQVSIVCEHKDGHVTEARLFPAWYTRSKGWMVKGAGSYGRMQMLRLAIGSYK